MKAEPEPSDPLVRALAAAPPIADIQSERLGAYFRLRRELGRGGFGVVYEADDLRHGCRVAVKVLRRPEAERLNRFKAEFRTLAGIVHPHLVRLEQLVGDDGRWFFSMELVDGTDFVTHLCGCPTPAEPAPARPAVDEVELRRAFDQLLDGLAAIHAAGKVHRDVKPSNVLVTPAGRVVVIDLGMVSDTQSVSESLGGTPAYMSPEQVAGDPVGPAADVYAVGVMLYEVLTGQLPITGTLYAMVAKKRLPVRSPRALRPDIPADLDELCMRMLEPDPSRRLALDGARQVLLGRPTRSAGDRLEPARPPLFVGRHLESALLLEAFERRSVDGRAGLVICGESGIGKSALLRQFVGELGARHPTLQLFEGRCHEREQVPYNALDGAVDGVARLLGRLPTDDAAALLPNDAILLTRSFPVLSRLPALARLPSEATALSPSDERDRSLSALRELFTRLAARAPTLLVAEDLQWADDDSLLALSMVCRAPCPPGLVFVSTHRESPGRAGTSFDDASAKLSFELRRVDLAGLAANEAEALVASMHGGPCPPDLGRQIAAESAGHPLFIEQLVRYEQRRRPHGESEQRAPALTLDTVVAHRLDELEPEERGLAELIATAQRPIWHRVAMRAARLDPEAFKACSSRLADLGLVRARTTRTGSRIEMYHDRLRAALLGQLGPEPRRALHATLALAHEAEASSDDEALATHWREAGDAPAAVDYAVRAGRAALRALAFDGAATWFEQALALLAPGDPRRRSLQLELASALNAAGRGALAVPHLEAAARDSDGLDAANLRCQAAQQLWRTGQVEQGRALSRAVLDELGVRVPRSALGALLGLLRDELDLRVRGVSLRAAPGGEGSLDGVRADACWSFGASFGESLHPAEALLGLMFQQRALRYSLDAGDARRSVGALSTYVMAASAPGRRSAKRTAQLLERLEQLVRRDGSSRSRALFDVTVAVRSYFNGEIAGAARGLAAAIDDPTRAAVDFNRERGGIMLRFLLRSLWMLGWFRQLDEWHARGTRVAAQRGDAATLRAIDIMAGSYLQLVRDQPGEAERLLDAALATGGFPRDDLMSLNALLARVTVKRYAREVDAAHAVAAETLARTRRSRVWQMQPTRLLVLHAVGSTALARAAAGDQRERALREVARAAAAIERERASWMRPYSRLLRAGVSLQRGEHAAATLELSRASAELSAREMHLAAAAVDARLGQLAGGPALSDAARRRFGSEGVVAPERWVETLVPL